MPDVALTSNVPAGLLVPIPTLPLESIRIRSVYTLELLQTNEPLVVPPVDTSKYIAELPLVVSLIALLAPDIAKHISEPDVTEVIVPFT